jgi:Tol biopolymer transport system component
MAPNQNDLWILPLDSPHGRPGKPIPFLTTPANEANARFSPDGRWIAYTSDTTGRTEAFIRAFPGGPPGEWPVSGGGASNLAWRDDGKELFYRSPSPAGGGALIATAIRFLPNRVEIGAAERLFTSFNAQTTNVSENGQRFLVFQRPSERRDERYSLTVVLNVGAEVMPTYCAAVRHRRNATIGLARMRMATHR